MNIIFLSLETVSLNLKIAAVAYDMVQVRIATIMPYSPGSDKIKAERDGLLNFECQQYM